MIGEHLLAIFTGTHCAANGLDSVLGGDRILKGRGRDDVKIALVGGSKEKATLKATARKESLNKVLFLDSIPKSKLSGLLAGADECLQILKNGPVFITVRHQKNSLIIWPLVYPY